MLLSSLYTCLINIFCPKIETGADEDESEDSDSECNEVLDLSKVTEMRLIPSDASHCAYILAFSSTNA